MKLFLLFFIICIAAALQQEDGKKGLSKRRKSFSVGNRNINLRKPIKAGKKVPKNKMKKKRKNNIAAKKRTTRIRKTGRKQAGKKVPKNKSKKKKARLSGRQQNSTTWETCFENSVTALRRYKGLFTY